MRSKSKATAKRSAAENSFKQSDYSFGNPPRLIELLENMSERKTVNDVIWAVTNVLKGIYLEYESDAKRAKKLNQLIKFLSEKVVKP